MVRGRWAPPATEGRSFRARVSGERPRGAASCRQQYNQASCQAPPQPPCALPRAGGRGSQDGGTGACVRERGGLAQQNVPRDDVHSEGDCAELRRGSWTAQRQRHGAAQLHRPVPRAGVCPPHRAFVCGRRCQGPNAMPLHRVTQRCRTTETGLSLGWCVHPEAFGPLLRGSSA